MYIVTYACIVNVCMRLFMFWKAADEKVGVGLTIDQWCDPCLVTLQPPTDVNSHDVSVDKHKNPIQTLPMSGLLMWCVLVGASTGEREGGQNTCTR